MYSTFSFPSKPILQLSLQDSGKTDPSPSATLHGKADPSHSASLHVQEPIILLHQQNQPVAASL